MQTPIQAKVQDRDNLSRTREARSQVDGSKLQASEQDRGTLQTQSVNPDTGGSLTRKGKTPLYFSKFMRRQKTAGAKAKLAESESDNGSVDGDHFGFTGGFVLCLPLRGQGLQRRALQFYGSVELFIGRRGSADYVKSTAHFRG